MPLLSCRISASGSATCDIDLHEALFESKVDAFAQEYTHLLVTQLDSQRQYYEGLLKSKDAHRASVEAQTAIEAQAVAKNALQQVKKAQDEAKSHLQVQKNMERKLVWSHVIFSQV